MNDKGIIEPNFRTGTAKAIEEIAEELHIPYHATLQDWSYTMANAQDIEKYISYYCVTNNDDKKFVIMEFIIQATEYQNSQKLFLKYCTRVKPMLEKDFGLHAYTIHYWGCFDRENLKDCFKITPLMRKIWVENQVKDVF